MDVLVLGAGRPARGDKPSALKQIALDTKAMDWQIRSFDALGPEAQIHYLGGYHVDEVIRGYPGLRVTVIPNWESQGILHTLLQAPFSNRDALVSYSDTVFRAEVIESLLSHDLDVCFAVDSCWEQRYRARSREDIGAAETIELGDYLDGARGVVEFTGLIHLRQSVVAYLGTVSESAIGRDLVDLLVHLRDQGFKVAPFDVEGRWAEFNSPADIAHFILGTKAETLARLEPLVELGTIGEQVTFTTAQWQRSRAEQIENIEKIFGGCGLAVRSSALSEDGWRFSNAGEFASFVDVDGGDTAAIATAIDAVIESYGVNRNEADQILVQRRVEDVCFAGVVLTCDLETGAAYYRFNFDDESNSTQSVTAGGKGDLRTIVLSRMRPESLARVEARLVPVLRAVQELEELLGFDKLDIEFAVDSQLRVHIFQVRPITVDHSRFEVEDEVVSASLGEGRDYFCSRQQPSPFVVGARTVFGNMSDWNPAEIIGIRPLPLALSLYQQLIADEVWATQRAEFGYRDVRPLPLIVTFAGQPYVDLRASLNSFIPAAVSDQIAESLVEAYLGILVERPPLHDKIEFEVAFTVWTPYFKSEATARLERWGVSPQAIDELGEALATITRRAITRLDADTASIAELAVRRDLIEGSTLPPIDRALSLLEDCRRLGTPAFAHAARAGFVATSLLKAFVATEVLSENRCAEFMLSVDTVASQFQRDKHALARGDSSMRSLIARYGHLRPGTYEVQAQAYWEDPDRYLACERAPEHSRPELFELSSDESGRISVVLEQLGAPQSPGELIAYLKAAIRSREAVKFEFTRNLSRALDACVLLGGDLGLSRDDCAFLEVGDLLRLRRNGVRRGDLEKQIAARRGLYAVTQMVQLPSLIADEEDFFCFERPSCEPNFVTNKRVEGRVASLGIHGRDALRGRVVFISQADPGFDWLFGHEIGGLITEYGGANSHMAIRAAEMGLPAAIGVGEKLYERSSRWHRIELDCANRVIREIR